MWLQSELSPYFADARLTHSEFFGQSITTPMRRAVARTASRQFQDPRLGRRTTSPVLVTTVARSQANQTLLNEALLPNANVSISATQSTTNLTVGMPSGQEQNQFCSFHQLRRQRSAPCTALQLPAFRRSQYQPIPIHALNLSEMLYESRTCYTSGIQCKIFLLLSGPRRLFREKEINAHYFAMNSKIRLICFINAHKILVPPIILGMMYWFHNWSAEAFVYLGL